MRNFPRYILVGSLILGAGCAGETQLGVGVGVATPVAAVSVATFDDALAPYGGWLTVRGHRVWQPSVSVVGADFVPYMSDGHWVATDLGWSFASDFDWGWGPFHYGRWFDEPGIGWVWEPGDVWAPAWVTWRDGADLVGWAPLAPDWCLVPPVYVFIQTRFLRDHRLHDHLLSPAHRLANLRRTRAIEVRGGAAWWPGPGRFHERRMAAPRPRMMSQPRRGSRPRA